MLKKPQKTWIAARRLLLYIGLALIIKFVVKGHDFSPGIYILLSSIFLVPELISDFRPQLLAYLFINRRLLVGSILVVCHAAALLYYLKYPLPAGLYQNTFEGVKYTISIVLQGATIGLATRMLILHTFYQLIRARDIFISKILILVVYAVFLLMLPVRHTYFLSFYLSGFSLGFLLHYIARVSERRKASYSRLAQNLLSMVESVKRGGSYKLSSDEDKAINLYARQKWNRLYKFLRQLTYDTEVIFFIRLSMLRKQHKYGEAINAIDIKQKENPAWCKDTKHFFLLIRALNQNELIGNTENSILNREVFTALYQAVRINKSCLLSNATLALKLANDIDLDAPKPFHRRMKIAAEMRITRALNIYEEADKNPRIISLVTGFAIPFTYSFLLDSFGYVQLKNGKLRFSKAFFVQCLYQDPSFSSSYQHISEWYLEFHKKHDNENWKKAAKLNLYIAIYNEGVDNAGGTESFISGKARKILSTL